jgi:hypothetical protein
VPSRHIMKILISPQARKRLETLSEQFGTTHVTAIARLVKWFEEQPEEIQHSILELHSFHPDPKEITNAVLQKMSRKS